MRGYFFVVAALKIRAAVTPWRRSTACRHNAPSRHFAVGGPHLSFKGRNHGENFP